MVRKIDIKTKKKLGEKLTEETKRVWATLEQDRIVVKDVRVGI